MPTTAAETMVWCETSKTQTHRKCTAYVGNALHVIFQLEAARNLFPLRPAHVDGPGGWHTSARMLQTREGPKAKANQQVVRDMRDARQDVTEKDVWRSGFVWLAKDKPFVRLSDSTWY